MEVKVMERYNDFLVDCITTFGEKRKCRHSVLFSETRGQENRKRKKKTSIAVNFGELSEL